MKSTHRRKIDERRKMLLDELVKRGGPRGRWLQRVLQTEPQSTSPRHSHDLSLALERLLDVDVPDLLDVAAEHAELREMRRKVHALANSWEEHGQPGYTELREIVAPPGAARERCDHARGWWPCAGDPLACTEPVDSDALALAVEKWGERVRDWLMRPASFAAPPCAGCGWLPRLTEGGTAVMLHAPGCGHGPSIYDEQQARDDALAVDGQGVICRVCRPAHGTITALLMCICEQPCGAESCTGAVTQVVGS